jgi:hypothetical protein
MSQTKAMNSERWHGTVDGYTNHRCRCEGCREAIRVDRQKRRSRSIPDHVKHGAYTYNNWGCYCQVCREGARDRQRSYYRARKRAQVAS